ncbi:MAG: type II toxin-antitoxin system RatA family toxin [Magnetospirillum sp.]|nr:type II toxin-antitoxin system RatA family toxin [Magnetospirillum sp.]
MSALLGGWHVDFPHHDPEQMFALAVDIESYPRFIPWCQKARIRQRREHILDVDNVFGTGPLQARFQSTAELDPPHGLTITSADGPFRRFRLQWHFSPLGEGGCRVEAEYEMVLRSPLMHSLASMTLPPMEHKVVHNFKERVRQVYGR